MLLVVVFFLSVVAAAFAAVDGDVALVAAVVLGAVSVWPRVSLLVAPILVVSGAPVRARSGVVCVLVVLGGGHYVVSCVGFFVVALLFVCFLGVFVVCGRCAVV